MKKGEKGFTLIELLAVIIILGIVVGIVILLTSGSSKKAKEKSEEVFVGTLKDAINVYLDSESSKLASADSWKYACSVSLSGQRHEFSILNEKKSFDDIIHSDYAPISADDLVNPADPSSENTCDISKDNISIYKDANGTKYFFFTLNCLNYSCYASNLPKEVLDDGSCGIVLPVCNSDGGEVVVLGSDPTSTIIDTDVSEEPDIPVDEPIIPVEEEPEPQQTIVNKPTSVKISSSKDEYNYGSESASVTCSFSGGNKYIVQFGTSDTVDSTITWTNDITVNSSSYKYEYSSIAWKGKKAVRCRVKVVDGSNYSEWKNSDTININFIENVESTFIEAPTNVTISSSKDRYVYGSEKSSVTCNVDVVAGKEYIYQFGKSDSSSGSVSWSSKTFKSNKIEYDKDAWLGEKYIKCRVKIKEGTKESEWTVSSNNVKIDYYEMDKQELYVAPNDNGRGTAVYVKPSKFFVTNCYFSVGNSFGEVNNLYEDNSYSFYGEDVKIVFEGYEYNTRKFHHGISSVTNDYYELENPVYETYYGYLTTEDVSKISEDKIALRLVSGDYFEYKISNLAGGKFLGGTTHNIQYFVLLHNNGYYSKINGKTYPSGVSCYKKFQVDMYWSLF